ncbi:MAG TPA: hypothetical protein VF584_16845 [Longimicrobium sp.]|jgi:hypothetical protein
MKHLVRTPLFLAIVLGVQASCQNPAGGDKKPPEVKTPSISGAVLTAGGDGVLTGAHLDQLPASITVDGVAVTWTSRTATEARFAMPAARPCEVDGRPIVVQAGTMSHTGALKVASTIDLQVGESRVLTREQLATLCLQLPAGTNRYVFTALNPSLVYSPAPDTLFTVHGWTGAGGSAASVSSTVSPRLGASALAARLDQHAALHNREYPRQRSVAGPITYSENPPSFDPRYATATVGDTVIWADLWNDPYGCDKPRNQVPTFPIVVAATSTSGKTVLAYDSRTRHSAGWSSVETRNRLTRAADMMERWALPAAREILGADFQPPKGAGGRWWHVFRSDIPGWTSDGRVGAPVSICPNASELIATISHDLPPQHDSQMEYLAGLLIHEYGHSVEDVFEVRRWGTFGEHFSHWAAHEAWAQSFQETAARLASNQPTAARYSGLVTGVPYADFYLNGYGESPLQSPWGTVAGDRGGVYDQGARFLMFLREQWGDATLGSTKERYYARVLAIPRYGISDMAALVGMDATTALDRWSLAEAIDDIVDPAVVAARSLPQIQTWVPQDNGPLSSTAISKTANTARRLVVGRGNYAAVYAWDYNADAGKGISLTFSGFGSAPFIARITRVK